MFYWSTAFSIATWATQRFGTFKLLHYRNLTMNMFSYKREGIFQTGVLKLTWLLALGGNKLDRSLLMKKNQWWER